MSDLQTSRYFLIRTRIRHYWNSAQGVFAYLDCEDQQVLHRYFMPDEELDQAELLSRIGTAVTDNPQLAEQAELTLERLDKHAIAWAMRHVQMNRTAPTDTRLPRGKVIVWPVYRPKPDYTRLVATLYDYVRRQQEAAELASSNLDEGGVPRRAA